MIVSNCLLSNLKNKTKKLRRFQELRIIYQINLIQLSALVGKMYARFYFRFEIHWEACLHYIFLQQFKSKLFIVTCIAW